MSDYDELRVLLLAAWDHTFLWVEACFALAWGWKAEAERAERGLAVVKLRGES